MRWRIKSKSLDFSASKVEVTSFPPTDQSPLPFLPRCSPLRLGLYDTLGWPLSSAGLSSPRYRSLMEVSSRGGVDLPFLPFLPSSRADLLLLLLPPPSIFARIRSFLLFFGERSECSRLGSRSRYQQRCYQLSRFVETSLPSFLSFLVFSIFFFC